MLFRPVLFAMCLAFVVCSGVVAQDRPSPPLAWSRWHWTRCIRREQNRQKPRST